MPAKTQPLPGLAAAAVLLLTALQLQCGCGRQAPLPTPRPEPPPPSVDVPPTPPVEPAEAAIDEADPEDSAEQQEQPEAPPEPDAASDEPVQPVSEDLVQAAIRDAVALEQDGRLGDALAACRELADTLEGDPRAAEVQSILSRVEQELRDAPDLLYAVDALASDNNWKVLMAQRQLAGAGELGAILLRRAVREDSERIALEAARTLMNAGDQASLKLLAARLKRSANTNLAGSLLTGLILMHASLPHSEFFPLLKDALDGLGRQPDLIIAHAQSVPMQPRARADANADADHELIAIFLDPKSAHVESRIVAAACHALHQRRPALAESICTYMLDPDREATLYGRTAQTLPDRFEQLLRLGVSRLTLAQSYHENFYSIVHERESDVVERMSAFAERLNDALPAGDEKEMLKTVRLDAAFILKDYPRALRVIEEGIADRDAMWHAMTSGKVEAYQAIAEGKPREAAKHFRDTMSYYEQSYKPVRDPVNGMTYTAEMLMARNAKRIGDLLAEAEDPVGTQQAYAEARAYYAKALADVAAGSPEHAMITSELAGVPAEPEATPAPAPAAP